MLEIIPLDSILKEVPTYSHFPSILELQEK